MKNQQSGFTLLELIAVLVILAILAVTALPRFTDLTAGAKQAALDGIAGNLSSAMALNYAGAVANAAGVSPALPSQNVDDCDDGSLVLLGGVPAGYTITAQAVTSLGNTATCVLVQTAGGDTQTFTAIATIP